MRVERGFTLLEVLVALAIAAIALSALFDGTLDGLRATRVAGRTQEALSRARSHLAAIGRTGPLGSGTQSGDDGSGFRWQVRTTPLATAPVAGENGARAGLFAIHVSIAWKEDGGPREVALDTERLAQVAPAR